MWLVIFPWVCYRFVFLETSCLPQRAQVFPAPLQDAQGSGKGSETAAKRAQGLSLGLCPDVHRLGAVI